MNVIIAVTSIQLRHFSEFSCLTNHLKIIIKLKHFYEILDCEYKYSN